MKPRNLGHVMRYTRRSGLSVLEIAVLSWLACETNGTERDTDATNGAIALDLSISTRQVERGLSGLMSRGIIASTGRGRHRRLSIREAAVVPGYSATGVGVPVSNSATGVGVSPPRASVTSATGGGVRIYRSDLPDPHQTSDEQTDVGLAGEGGDDLAPETTTRETRAERRVRWGERSTAEREDALRQKPVRTSEPPRPIEEPRSTGAPRAPEGREPPRSAPPPAGPAGHANVTGARASTDPLSPEDLARLTRLELDANPERLTNGAQVQAIHQLLQARARVEGWTVETLEGLWLDALGWGLNKPITSWSFLFHRGFERRRAEHLERSTRPSSTRRPPAMATGLPALATTDPDAYAREQIALMEEHARKVAAEVERRKAERVGLRAKILAERDRLAAK